MRVQYAGADSSLSSWPEIAKCLAGRCRVSPILPRDLGGAHAIVLLIGGGGSATSRPLINHVRAPSETLPAGRSLRLAARRLDSWARRDANRLVDWPPATRGGQQEQRRWASLAGDKSAAESQGRPRRETLVVCFVCRAFGRRPAPFGAVIIAPGESGAPISGAVCRSSKQAPDFAFVWPDQSSRVGRREWRLSAL